VIVLASIAAGCARKDNAATTGPSSALGGDPPLTVTSASFPPSGPIPTKYTCEGSDTSPALAWSDAPSATKSLAVIVDDPDAPDPAAPKEVFVHWVLYDVPATAKQLPEGVKSAANVRGGARDGKNDYGKAGWSGPCPPKGRHRYFFRVYALDTVLPDLGLPTKAELEKAMSGHVIAKGEVVGTYEKQAK
jgi:Raf kinase inhibitor-like YbhB/YbcL family protein